jgi:NAD(P)H-flavin reductase
MSMDQQTNPYIPYPVRIDEITIENETRDLKTFKVAFVDPKHEKAFNHIPGQFAELSLLGKGECPIGIASSPTEEGYLLFTVKKTGVVTRALHNLTEGKVIGVRGPLGKPYPIDRMKGKNVVIVGGGFAFTTLRALTKYMIEDGNRAEFGEITVIYGARSPGELLYKQELKEWETHDDLKTYVTVDRGDENWKGREGFVPAVLEEVAPSSKDALLAVCGPPIMIKFSLPVIERLGFAPGDTILSLEMRMKCGIGKCGHCNIGSKYVCKDGPVFTLEELGALPAEY